MESLYKNSLGTFFSCRLECHSEEDDLRRTFEVEDEEVTCVRVKERVCGRNSRGEETCRDVPK